MEKCPGHDALITTVAKLEQDLENFHETADDIKKKLDQQMQYYMENRLLIEQMSKDLNNGIHSKVNNMDNKMSGLFKDVSDIKKCLFKKEIEEATGFDNWLKTTFNKAKDNIGLVIAVALIYKLLCWISNLPTIEKIIG